MPGPEQISPEEMMERIVNKRRELGYNDDGTRPDAPKHVGETLQIPDDQAEAFVDAVIKRYKDYDLTK